MGKKTNKTEHVLKLLTGSSNNEVANPILNEEFKHEKIHTRHNDENQYKSEAVQKSVKVDILNEIVKENIDSVIERFNICNSDESKNEIIINTLRETKPVYVNVTDNDYEEVNKQKNIYKSEIISNLVKYAIKTKAKSI